MRFQHSETKGSMERVKTLIDKLKQLSDAGASAEVILRTVQMLQAELLSISGDKKQGAKGKISVIMPAVAHTFSSNKHAAGQQEEDKVFEVLQVDQEELEKELAEIKRHEHENSNKEHFHSVTENFDPIADVPTLAHQPYNRHSRKLVQGKIEYPETTEQEELNDKLKQLHTEISDSLASTPIKDLRKAIGVNDRFVFINELFREDEAMYERSVKTIQGFDIFAEAEFWIRRELKLKLGWSARDQKIVRQFDDLVRRRFL